ncbi:MAG TPA: hypothetical protein VEF04_11500, partial [Blastocatellia bacterium]|nr:hypothetical protein [Blastocatellia bacterium]
MDYERRAKLIKMAKIAAVAVAVIAIIVFALFFFTAKKNADSEGRAYSVKDFIIDFGSALRGKKLSSDKVFDGGLFPVFGLGDDDNLPSRWGGLFDGGSETRGPQCSNGTDDNDNGNTDYPADANCVATDDWSEL